MPKQLKYSQIKNFNNHDLKRKVIGDNYLIGKRWPNNQCSHKIINKLILREGEQLEYIIL